MNQKNLKKQGFALLYALLLTGAILTIGVIMMNIVTRQLIYSSVSRNSEMAYYYAANSGRECLTNAISGGDFVDNGEAPNIGLINSVTIKCFGDQEINFIKEAGGIYKANEVAIDGDPNTKLDLEVRVNIDCLNTTMAGACATIGGTEILKGKEYFAIAYGYGGAVGSGRLAKRAAVYVVRGK